MWYYWTDERYQITYSKRVTHAVKMVDSSSRENGILYTVTRSWLLFLHDESEWKIFDNEINVDGLPDYRMGESSDIEEIELFTDAEEES